MNQILVTKKLYITPELKKKKRAYKIYFFISIFLIVIFVSLYFYAEYARNKEADASASLLENFNQEASEMGDKKNVLVAVLDSTEDDSDENEIAQKQNIANIKKSINKKKKIKTDDGYTYSTIASINIPKINVAYPIIDGETDSVEETEALLKIAPTKFWGPDPNTVGNFCVVGHNYRNTKFFSKVPTLENGDVIEITDGNGTTLRYGVYTKYEVDPNDISCIDQNTNGKKEVTLITCTNDSKLRVIVKARAL